MKRKILFSAILIAGFMIVDISVHQAYGQTPQDKSANSQKVEYTCPHHPEVVQNMPGKCPKCGMTLVEKKHNSNEYMHSKGDSTRMKTNHRKMMHDSTEMRKDPMNHDTVYRKQDGM